MPPECPTMKNSRFPALSFFSALFIGLGWAFIVIGILLLAFCAIGLFSSSAAADLGIGPALAAAMPFELVSVGLVFTGLFTVTGGESIRVFLAIEANTRAWTAVVRPTE